MPNLPHNEEARHPQTASFWSSLTEHTSSSRYKPLSDPAKKESSQVESTEESFPLQGITDVSSKFHNSSSKRSKRNKIGINLLLQRIDLTRMRRNFKHMPRFIATVKLTRTERRNWKGDHGALALRLASPS